MPIVAILSVVRRTNEIEALGLPVPPGSWHPLTMHSIDVAAYCPDLLLTVGRPAHAEAERLTRRDRNRQVGRLLDGRILWGAYPCDAPDGEDLMVRYEVRS